MEFEVALEQIGQRAAAKVRRLRRRPHRQHVTARIVIGQYGAPFERHGAAAMERQLLLEHMCRARKCSVDVAIGHGNDGGNVGGKIAVSADRAGSRGSAIVAHRRQDLEIDLHRRGGVLRQVAVGRDHDRDGLADITDLVARQRELRARRPDRGIGHQHRNLAGRHARGQIVRREYRVHAGHGARRGSVDGADPGMGVRCAHEACVQRAGYQDVIDETTAPGEQCRIFEARDAGAEMVRAHGRCPRTAQRGKERYTRSVALQSRQNRTFPAVHPVRRSGRQARARRRHLPMSSVVWLWRPVPASAGTVLMPEIVSRRGLSDARRERRSAPIRTTAGGAAA